MESQRFDVAVVGAGMAGASIAAELAPHVRVLLLEAEDRPGYHATGRSAAFWMESYGGPAVQPLTAASRAFLAVPPPAWRSPSLLSPLGCLHVADRDGVAALAALADRFTGTGVRLDPIGREAIEGAMPNVRAGWDHALAEPTCAAIDVAALHTGYLDAARRAGGIAVTHAALRHAVRRHGIWRIETAAGVFEAPVLVNAAGAWADAVAQNAGARPIGIAPYRRTMVQVRVSPAPAPAMPLIIDALERFYFKRESSARLWLSPHDETAAPAGDAAPDEMDVAKAIALLETIVECRVEAVERRWAGLRSFAPDRLPIYGFDRRAAGFFWFAGQGGFGIQTAPAAARLAAALLLDRSPDENVAAVDVERFSPSRLA